MQNILAAIFQVESEGYQAITTLSKEAVDKGSTILQMVLVKREGSNIKVCDSFDSGILTNDDTLMGGLIGGLVGILGGPIGVLLMGSYGALAGSIVDTGDAVDSVSLMEKVAEKLQDGETALIALVEEEDEANLDGKLGKYQVEILRFDAEAVEAEIEEALKVQKEIDRQARAELRAARKKKAKDGIDSLKNNVNSELESIKTRFKKEKKVEE